MNAVLKKITFLFVVLCFPVYAGIAVKSERDPLVSWVDYGSNYRYLLILDFGWEISKKSVQDDWKYKPLDIANQHIAGYFDPSYFLIHESKKNPGLGDLSVLRLDINKDHFVQKLTLKRQVVEIRLNRLEQIVLAPVGESFPGFTIRVGQLFLGAPYATDPSYVPGICSGLDMQADPNFNGRYQKKFRADTNSILRGFEGYFGCREWAAQLYDENRPYIDVTSYEWGPDITRPKKGGKYPVGPVTYIKPFIGFSRFQDAPKPVIGQHLGQWYCITDCPEGNAPGKIENIRLWAAKQGWSVPERPENVRRFINQKPDYEDFED
jgi:hypothetical protein